MSFDSELKAHRAAAADMLIRRREATRLSKAEGSTRHHNTSPPQPPEHRETLRLVSEARTNLRTLARTTPDVVINRIEALPTQIRNQVGSIIWWECFGDLASGQAPKCLDHYINAKHADNDTEQLTAALYAVGFPALVAFKRARINPTKYRKYATGGRPAGTGIQNFVRKTTTQ